MRKSLIVILVLCMLSACKNEISPSSENEIFTMKELPESNVDSDEFVDPRPDAPVQSPTHALVMLIRQLEDEGFTKDSFELQVEEFGFNGKPTSFTYMDEQVVVYEYAVPSLAALDASYIKGDGFSFAVTDSNDNGMSVHWDYSVRPNYFLYDTLLIQYVGENINILQHLNDITDYHLFSNTSGNILTSPPNLYLIQNEQKAPAVIGTHGWRYLIPMSYSYSEYEADSDAPDSLIEYQDRKFLVERGSRVELVFNDEPFSYVVKEFLGSDNDILVDVKDGSFLCNSLQDSAIYTVKANHLQGIVHYSIEVLFTDSYKDDASRVRMIEQENVNGLSVIFSEVDLWDFDFGDIVLKEIDGRIHYVINTSLNKREDFLLSNWYAIGWPELSTANMVAENISFRIGSFGLSQDLQQLDAKTNYNIVNPMRYLNVLSWSYVVDDTRFMMEVRRDDQLPYVNDESILITEEVGSEYITVQVRKIVDSVQVELQEIPSELMPSIEYAKEVVLNLSPQYSKLEIEEE